MENSPPVKGGVAYDLRVTNLKPLKINLAIDCDSSNVCTSLIITTNHLSGGSFKLMGLDSTNLNLITCEIRAAATNLADACFSNMQWSSNSNADRQFMQYDRCASPTVDVNYYWHCDIAYDESDLTILMEVDGYHFEIVNQQSELPLADTVSAG
jgi:hypothetical protein